VKPKLLGVLTSLVLLATTGQSFSATITAFYQGNDFTTNLDPQRIGPRLYAQVSLEFGPSVLSAADVTGTYTLADNLQWISLFNVGTADYFVSSSQGPNFIDPKSYVTFDHGVITDWAIVGNAAVSGTAFLETVSQTTNPFGAPVGDYILQPDGSYAISTSPATWTDYSYTGFPVPGPTVGAGLPGLVFAAAGLLMWRRRKRADGVERPLHCPHSVSS
jgi:hypothetical protein